MKLWNYVLLSIILTLVTVCMVSADNQSVTNSTPDLNQTNTTSLIHISPQEELMNLAFAAREFALENGKEKAITEFSNPSGQFSTKGRYVIAYDMDGTLLANMKVPGEVGSKFIKDDYDAGQVRMMRDMATTGGGLYTDPATGAFWFIMDVDGSWWICAAQYQISGQ